MATTGATDDDRGWAVLATLRPELANREDALKKALREVAERGSGGAAFELDPSELARHVALCVADAGDVEAALQGLHAEDLALAFGCAQGDPVAVAQFRERFEPDAVRVVAKYPVLTPDRADVVQDILARLLVARADAPPRIGDYRGSGPLQGWFRVAALRLTMDRIRALDRKRLETQPEPEAKAGPTTPLRSIEDRYVQQAFGDAIRTSVEQAFTDLSARERNLLRHSVLQGLTIDQIAPIYGVHRATAARWLDRARSSLADAARKRLVDRHGIAASEVLSVMRCVRSQVDLSVSRLLGRDPEDDDQGA